MQAKKNRVVHFKHWGMANFRHWCIFCGCDYLPKAVASIPNMGPKTSAWKIHLSRATPWRKLVKIMRRDYAVPDG